MTQSVGNPFAIGEYIGREYFCDRENELSEAIEHIQNRRNVVLMSPRRMGKTGLLHRLFDERQVSDSCHCVYLDIYATSSLAEFVYVFGRAIYEQLKDRQTMLRRFVAVLRSLSMVFNADPITGAISMNMNLGDIRNPQLTLDEIFRYLEQADRTCLVAIDEFQQVCRYAERNVEALLRTYMQQCRNCRFIFAGSQMRMMSQMFMSAARPFYMSAVNMTLQPLGKDVYTRFAQRLFEDGGRTLTDRAAAHVYELTGGVTMYMQLLMNYAYNATSRGGQCDEEGIERSLNRIISSNSANYAEEYARLSVKQKQVLLAIARDGQAENVTSALFIRSHSLPSPSSVQSALKPLLENEIVSRVANTFFIYDRFFSIWLSRL